MKESELPIQKESSKEINPPIQEERTNDSESNQLDSVKTLNIEVEGEIINNKTPSDVKINKEFIDLALKDLKDCRNILIKEIEELSNRKSQLDKEIKESFAGQSDAIARRLKGFQEYLTGAFQDLAQSAEQLELVAEPLVVKPSPLDEEQKTFPKEQIEHISAVADTFKPDEGLIRDSFAQFLQEPDFYADPWKFRRSLEKKDIELLEDWFFSMGGRGAQPSRGSRPKNVLVAAALIAILGELYGDRFQTLVLASQPERLGEWRRGLQDALGLNREDFGPNSGIVLFERPDGLIEKADELEEKDDVPLILIDAAEVSVDIPILQFPIWLAFSGTPGEFYEEEELI